MTVGDDLKGTQRIGGPEDGHASFAAGGGTVGGEQVEIALIVMAFRRPPVGFAVAGALRRIDLHRVGPVLQVCAVYATVAVPRKAGAVQIIGPLVFQHPGVPHPHAGIGESNGDGADGASERHHAAQQQRTGSANRGSEIHHILFLFYDNSYKRIAEKVRIARPQQRCAGGLRG